MSELPLVNWDHSLFGDLQLLLDRAWVAPSTSGIRQLFAKLDEARPWLLALTSLPGQNDAGKAAVEKGPITLPSGASVTITGDLLTLVNGISSTLNISQLLAAVLAVQSETLRPQYPSRTPGEIAIFALHEWLAEMLDFVRELLRVTIAPGADQSAPFDHLRAWVEELLSESTSLGYGKGNGTMVDQILGQVDAIQEKLSTLLRSGPCSGVDYEMLSFRVGALRAQQNKLVGLLGAIAEGGNLGRGHLVKILKWLKKKDKMETLVGTVLTAVMAAIRPIDSLEHTDVRYDVLDEWCKDVRFLKVVSGLVIQDSWSITPLREATKLCWIFFYISALRHDPNVSQIGIDNAGAEQFLLDSIYGEAFQLLRQTLLSVRQERGLEERDEAAEAAEDALVRVACRSDPANDDFIYRQLQYLVDGLSFKKGFLRNLRAKEEDHVRNKAQSSRAPAVYQAFLAFAATVYKSLPEDSASHFWDSAAFTNAILDSRLTNPGLAFWEFITAISAGKSCASKAHERLKETRWNWQALIKFYQHYHEIMPHLFEPTKPNRPPSMDPIAAEEVEFLQGWTRLLCTVVNWSQIARSSILQLKPNIIQMLFDMLNCDIPSHLKAGILDAISAFCRRTGDTAADEVISKAIEHYERISFLDPALDIRHLEGNRIPPPIGWMDKMEYAEVEANTYPLTRSYIAFLTALLPAPAAEGSSSRSIQPRLANDLRRGTYHVLDRVLLIPQARRYARDDERWEMLDAVFGYLEKALQSFDMTELLSQSSSRAISQIASSLTDEPGFTVLLRLLSEPAIFAPLAGSIETLSQLPQPRRSQITQLLQRAMRITHRVLDIQLIFSDVLLLTLSDPSRTSNTAFKRPLGLQSLDQHLLNHVPTINAIALLVGDDDLELALVATKIMGALAQSPVFSRRDVFRSEYATSVNRLAGLLDASDDSIRIAQGFCKRLEGEGEDISSDVREKAEKVVLRGEARSSQLELLPLVIRSAILDLLLDGTSSDAAGPNIAHFLLGFEFHARDFTLPDPRDPEARVSCVNVLLRQLSEGMDYDSSAISLVEVHPNLAAKSAQILHQLFSHPTTGRTTMSYASSTADFAALQLIHLPRSCSITESDQPGSGHVVVSDVKIPTTAETLVGYLDYQRWILSCVSLATFTYEGKGPSSSSVARALFRGVAEDDDDLLDEEERPALISDLLNTVDTLFHETVPESLNASRDLSFYREFNFDQFKRPEVDWYDIPALSRELQAFQRQHERSGALTIGAQSQAMSEEAEYIVKCLALRNRETDISLAKGSLIDAWNETLKVSLSMLFKHVSDEQQEVVLFELLDAILDRLTHDIPPGIIDILCESVLVTVSALVSSLADLDVGSQPVDQLSAVLVQMIDVVIQTGFSENARGNLFAAIGQYLQLVAATGPSGADDAVSLAASTVGRESIATVTPTPVSTALHRATIAAFTSKRDRFFTLLCRDAMDDRDVWKTECFYLLSAIVSICYTERDRQILVPVIQGGFLSLFVRSIKDREMALLECLGADATDLHAYWVYEAKIGFLMAVAATKQGAAELLDAGLFEIFAMCGFVAVQPTADNSMDDDSVARDTIGRQHRVLILTLQVLARTLSSLQRSQRSAAGHGISFLNAHREAILLLLRDNQQYITLIGMEELRLVVSILGMVVHKVPEEDLRSPVGFGALHLAVLAVASRFFDKDSWSDNIVNPSEMTQAQTQVLSLNQVLLNYLCTTTKGLKAGQGFPVLTTGTARTGANRTPYIATAPSLPMVAELLSDLAGTVEDVSAEYETMLDVLRSQAALDEDTIGKLVDADLYDDEGGVESIAPAFTSRIQLLFNSIESLLLLIWRHLLYYANDARHGQEPVRADTLSSSLGTFTASQLDGAASISGAATGRLLERVAGALRGTLERMDALDVHPDLAPAKKLMPAQAQAGQGQQYYQMLVRRMKELTAGLLGEVRPEQDISDV